MMRSAGNVTVRPAGDADLAAITAIARATGQDEDWDVTFPAYLRHLFSCGTFLVAERAGAVAGYGATVRIGSGPTAIRMLTDLFVDPAAHGTGIGRAILARLWRDAGKRMTFGSQHPHAVPLYTSFGLDAWWPLLYLAGDVRRLRPPAGWSVCAAEPARVAGLERAWTGLDRENDHLMWAARPRGSGVIADLDGRPMAAGTVGGAGAEHGISHLAVDVATISDANARDAVLAVLAWLDPAPGPGRVCLPAPHPAVRPLLASGWRMTDFDLYMASEPGLIDPLRAVPSPALA